MPAAQPLLRQQALIRFLRNHGAASLVQIAWHLRMEGFFEDTQDCRSTLNRDIRQIEQRQGICIEYDRSANGYDFVNSLADLNNRMLESLELVSNLQLAENAPYLHFESRRPLNTQHLTALLEAIKQRVNVRFYYQKYWEDSAAKRTVEPYALKEAQGRWYLLANDLYGKKLKTFGLDRMSDLYVTPRKFIRPNGLDVSALFIHSFGIINPEGQPPEEIELRFTLQQGRYIIGFPLHHTQQVFENEDSIIVRLTMQITFDFEKELLSYGEDVQVLQPEYLRDRIRERHRRAAGL
ncbi:helix-turn-helix transcriptional regulator [Mucilaginibacter sp.]